MNIIYFALVLGVTVFIHELGHFLFAKKAGIYVYEFAIGMGPVLHKFKRKNDETEYSIRLFPIGGYVSMAGEEIEVDEDIPKEKRIQSKTWSQRFLTVIAGVLFNFLLAILIFTFVAIFDGTPKNKNIISKINEDYPIYETNIKANDEIISINNVRVRNQDMLQLEIQANYGKEITLKVKHTDNTYETIKVVPKEEKENDTTTYKYGFYLENEYSHNFIDIIFYGFKKTYELVVQMFYTILYLVTGKLSLNSLSGPIGIYKVVGVTAEAGILNLIYLIGFLCINVGFINLLPLPAFDGGRIFFMLIEKITKKKLSPKVENTIHAVGLILLMILMVVITWNDIVRFIL